MNPMTVLQQAIRAVPAVKWALGVAGIIAVIAIVKHGWKIEPQVAVFGTIVMVVLMVLLVVFAKLSIGTAGDFRFPVLALTWASICLTIGAAVLLFWSVFFGKPLNFSAAAAPNPDLASPELKHVWDTQDRIMEVRATWEIIPTTGDLNKERVMDLAPKYGEEMLAIPDEPAGLRGSLLKYQYACYAFVISADVEPNKIRRIAFAQKAVSLCDKANSVIDKASQLSATDRKAMAVAEFARTDNARPRINYLSAMATCILAKDSGDPSSADRVTETLSLIPSSYLLRYPPAKDSVLRKCVKN